MKTRKAEKHNKIKKKKTMAIKHAIAIKTKWLKKKTNTCDHIEATLSCVAAIN